MALKKITGKDPEPLGLPCKKAIYHSLPEALDMIRHIQETRITRKLRAYQCPVCGFWHLTGSPEK
ncbi:MAG: hypothetical protein RBR81_11855 [Bacteroidales bacterium]|jgi:hypothetical protein|nr:hypothetical protein [Bacteroidales bacterium]